MYKCSTNQGQQCRKAGRALGDWNELAAPGPSILPGLAIFLVADRFSLGPPSHTPAAFICKRPGSFLH